LVDKYLENQAATLSNEARSVRSSSFEERYMTPVDSHSAVQDNNVSLQRNTRQTIRSRSLEECHNGEFGARYEADTAVKTCDAVCFRGITKQTDVQEFTEQSGTCISVSSDQPSNSINNEPGLNAVSDVECAEIDGPELDIASPQPSRQGSVLSPTGASLANDSGFVEQDSAAVLSLIPSVKPVTTTGRAYVQRKSVENHSEPVTLRNYQKELAELGRQGSNCIICAPTGSGKTFTAGYICKTRRNHAIAQGSRFKCLFVVCIRNLIAQQRDSLCQIMPDSGVICGMDDKLQLSEYFRHYDVVVATAQVCLCVVI